MMASRLLTSCILAVVSSTGIVLSAAQVWTGQAYPPSTQCVPRTDNPKDTTYESWISEYRKGPLGGSLTGRHQIQLAITVIDGDDLKAEDKIAPTLRSGLLHDDDIGEYFDRRNGLMVSGYAIGFPGRRS